ncbi:hypothetical protein Tco_0613627 [Tanacetum coccineum]
MRLDVLESRLQGLSRDESPMAISFMVTTNLWSHLRIPGFSFDYLRTVIRVEDLERHEEELARIYFTMPPKRRPQNNPTQTSPEVPLTLEAVNQLVQEGVKEAIRAERERVRLETTRGPAEGLVAASMARECTFSGFNKCGPTPFHGTKGVVGLIHWYTGGDLEILKDGSDYESRLEGLSMELLSLHIHNLQSGCEEKVMLLYNSAVATTMQWHLGLDKVNSIIAPALNGKDAFPCTGEQIFDLLLSDGSSTDYTLLHYHTDLDHFVLDAFSKVGRWESICFVPAPRFKDVGKESGSCFDSMERTLSLGSRDTKGVENSMAAPDAKLSPDLGFYMWYQSLVALDLGLRRWLAVTKKTTGSASICSWFLLVVPAGRLCGSYWSVYGFFC